MLRWMILAASFALWAGCMTLVYVNFKPAPRKATDAETQNSLERIFDPNAPLRRAWKIYAHPADLQQAKAMLGVESETPVEKKEPWNGVNEKGLVFAGKLDSKLKNKSKDGTAVDEETRLSLSFPGTPFECSYVGRGHLTLDKGLENSKFAMKLRYEGFEAEAVSSGYRDGSEYVMTIILTQNGQRLFNTTHREEVGEKVPAGGQLEPFQYRRDIDVGSAWEIHTIDFNAAIKGDKNIIQTLPVRCDRKVKIEMEGIRVPAYEVRSENGEARAWYSADGEVLKQTFKLAGAFDIMVVKDDEYKGKKKDGN